MRSLSNTLALRLSHDLLFDQHRFYLAAKLGSVRMAVRLNGVVHGKRKYFFLASCDGERAGRTLEGPTVGNISFFHRIFATL